MLYAKRGHVWLLRAAPFGDHRYGRHAASVPQTRIPQHAPAGLLPEAGPIQYHAQAGPEEDRESLRRREIAARVLPPHLVQPPARYHGRTYEPLGYPDAGRPCARIEGVRR